MSRFLTIEDNEVGLQYGMGVGKDVIKKVRDGNIDACINFAQSVLSEYEREPSGTMAFNKIMNGHKFFFDLDEKNPAMLEIIKDFILHGNYEPHTTEIVKKEVKEGNVCVDVGASHGYFTMLFASLVGDQGKVYSFEPTDNQFKYLTKNIANNNYNIRVIAENAAAWSEETMNPKLKINLGNSHEIRGIKLDDILPTKVDFIKIDVDGTELEVLKGLENTIKNNPQLKLIIEFYPKYIENQGYDPETVKNFLYRYFTCDIIEGDYGGEYWNYFCKRKAEL